MKQFSTKSSVIVAAISIFVLLAGVALVLFSRNFIDMVYEILSQRIFHREFDIAKWLLTMQSFFMVPIFLVVTVNAIIFPKYSEQTKIVLLGVLAAVMLFSITFACVSIVKTHGDSDLASELLLAKECVREKSLLVRGWYYSTEIRLLNTQLISAPLFLFTQNWYAVKIITSLVSCVALALACLFLLKRLNIESNWLILFCCVLVLSPWSNEAWYVSAWGCYYIPHAIMGMIYVAAFVKIADESAPHKKSHTIFFYVWAFISGLSTIRYIMIFVFPLALACFAISFADAKKRGGLSIVKDLWQNDGRLRVATLGLIASGIGYVFNNLVLQRLYSFSQWNTITFNTLGDVTLLDIFRATIQMFGYEDNIAVLTPGGVINLLVYAALVLFVAFAIGSWKHSLPYPHKILLAFFAASFFFNAFVYVHTEFIYRYFYPILIYLVPCLAVLLSNKTFSKTKRHILGALWAIALICSSFTTIQTNSNTSRNANRYATTRFLKNAGYTFGYATFWNANITTYLTNGKIEMGNMRKKIVNGKTYIADHYECGNWLTPKRYYGADYDSKRMFFLVTQEEYELAPNPRVFENGTLVYEDEWFKVFDYASVADFKAAF